MASSSKTTPDVPAGFASCAEPPTTIGNFCRPVPENCKLLSAEETVKEAVCPRDCLILKTRGQSHLGVNNETSPSVFIALVHQIFDLEATEFVPFAKFPEYGR
jgi:hypothetical protein